MSHEPALEPLSAAPRLAPVGRDRTPSPALAGASPRPEEEALRQAQAGDEQAFAVLVRRYGQPVLSLCYASTLDAAEAEDLAQEVFFAAWRGLPRFRGDSAFSTWLFALARNVCVDRARSAAARPRLARQESVEVPEPERGPDSARETALAVVRAASSLSLSLRQALLLRDLQGLSYEEIAALQAVPVGTVRSRIAAARAAVAKAVRA